MIRSARFAAFALAFWAATATAAAAPKADVVLFPPQAANLEPDAVGPLGAAIHDALAAALPESRVASPEEAAAALSTTGTPEAAAAALGADVWITCRAIRLDTIAEVVLTRHRPGMRPVPVRAPLPEAAEWPAAARTWVAALLAAPDPEPEAPIAADRRELDRLTWGLRAGGAWAAGDQGGPLGALEAELHSRSGRWFIAAAVAGRLPLTADEARPWTVGARLRSGLYGGSGPVWPAIWLGIEPRMVIASTEVRLGVLPVIGVGVDLPGPGSARLSIDLEAGYDLVGGEAAPEVLDGEAPAAEDDGLHRLEVGLLVGIGW